MRFLLWVLSVTFYIFHRHRACLVDCVDLICSCTAGGKVWVFFLSHPAPGFLLWFYFQLCMVVVPRGLLLKLPRRTWVCPVRARWGGGAAAWVAGILATSYSEELEARAPGNSALEGYGSQYWPIHSSVLAWRTPFPDKEAWQAAVFRATKSWTLPKRPSVRRHKSFFCLWQLWPSEAEVKVAQLHGSWGPWQCPACRDRAYLCRQSYSPLRDFFEPLVVAIRRPLRPVFLYISAHSGTYRAPLPGVLLCCSACQARRGAPWLGFSSVVPASVT